MTKAENPERPYDTLISAEENRAMFDRIAGYYDGTNRVLSLGLDHLWRRKAIRRLAPQPGCVYLDIGCGTGDMGLEIVKQCPGARVIGIDPSEGMLMIGREKVASRGLTDSVEMVPGDALSLPFSDHTFHGAITAFCIRNVTDRARCLKEIHRVIRPGGWLVILELTDPVGIMRPLFRIYSGVVIPLITWIMSSVSAYRYLTDSMADFPNADDFIATVKEAGFIDAGYKRLTGGITTLMVGRVPPE